MPSRQTYVRPKVSEDKCLAWSQGIRAARLSVPSASVSEVSWASGAVFAYSIVGLISLHPFWLSRMLRVVFKVCTVGH